MKKIIIPFALLCMLTSCGEANNDNKKEEKTDNKEQKAGTIKETNVIESEEELSAEGTEVEEDHRYDNISNETTSSDCYIVDYFVDMDIKYVTVDFVNYKVIETDSEPEYELVNEIKKLRTFVVNDSYLKCGRDSEATIEALFEKAKKDPKTVFLIETKDGLTTELFERLCAG